MSPQRAPTADELLNDPVVQQALAQAWIDSHADDSDLRHEEGGWIYIDLATGDFSVRMAPAGQRGEIDLKNPPHVSGSVIVGKFHTHPNPRAEGWATGPSRGDRSLDARHGVPDLFALRTAFIIQGRTIAAADFLAGQVIHLD